MDAPILPPVQDALSWLKSLVPASGSVESVKALERQLDSPLLIECITRFYIKAQERQRDTELAASLLLEVEKEMKARESFFESELRSLGLSSRQSFPPEVIEMLRSISQIAQRLGVPVDSFASITAVLDDLEERIQSRRQRLDMLKKQETEMATLLHDMQEDLQSLHRIRTHTEEQEKKNEAEGVVLLRQISELEKERRESYAEIQRAKEILQSCHFQEDFSHSSIELHRKQVDFLRAQTNAKKKKLDVYLGLPPDLAAAEQMVQEAEAEATRLTIEFEAKASQLSLG